MQHKAKVTSRYRVSAQDRYGNLLLSESFATKKEACCYLTSVNWDCMKALPQLYDPRAAKSTGYFWKGPNKGFEAYFNPIGALNATAPRIPTKYDGPFIVVRSNDYGPPHVLAFDHLGDALREMKNKQCGDLLSANGTEIGYWDFMNDRWDSPDDFGRDEEGNACVVDLATNQFTPIKGGKVRGI